MAQPLLGQQAAGPAADQAQQQQGALGRAPAAIAGGALVDRVGDEAGQAGDQVGAADQPGQVPGQHGACINRGEQVNGEIRHLVSLAPLRVSCNCWQAAL